MQIENCTDADRLLTPEQAAEMLQLAPQTLAVHRVRKTGPTALKLGPGRNAPVRYRLADVLAWVRADAA
jgi:predicted DNA-binding transcriptional regulator AlpA